jgi:hypothetical protein
MIENSSEMMVSVRKKHRESKWIEGRKVSKQIVNQIKMSTSAVMLVSVHGSAG